MNIFIVLVKKELAELLGTKKIFILGIVFTFFALLSVAAAKLIPELIGNMDISPGVVIKLPDPTYKDAIDQLVKNISQLGALILIFVVAGAIADEKTKKTLEMIVTKPIPRSSFVLAKAFSYMGVIKVLFLLSLVIFYAYAVAIFGSFSFWMLVQLAVMLLLLLALMVATLIFASVISSSALVASGIGFFGYIFYVGIWDLIKPIKDYSPGYIVSNYKVIVESGWNKDFLGPALVSIGMTALLLWLSVYFFKRQEVER
jgi:ABC-2 type transport system permease protein